LPSREVAKVALYERSMAEAFDRFSRAAWPSSGSAKIGGSKTPAGRSDAPTFVFLKGNDIIGHVTTIPVQLASHAGAVAAHWIVGFMVLPEHRNGLVGPLLIKEASRVLDCALSIFVEPPVLRILTGMKWAHRGVLPQYVRVLNARAVSSNLQAAGFKGLTLHAAERSGDSRARLVQPLARALAGWGLALGQAAWLGLSTFSRPRSAHAELHEERRFDESYDDLWRAVHARFGACPARDQRYLRQRYGEKTERYRFLGCRQGSRLLGYCILKIRQFSGDSRMGNMKVGTIVDCLFDPTSPAVLQSLLGHAVRLFEQEEVHAVLCTASHATVRHLLRANGFLAIPGNLHFAIHNRTALPIQDVPLDSWHLMRGDSDADQNF
jgi:hypothetical protein